MGRTVTSLATFTRLILSELPETPGGTVFFRGHASRDFALTPGLFRPPHYQQVEDQIFKDMLLHHPREFAEDDTALEYLVRMQHFYTPTRLLDLTENAFVALYFACLEVPTEVEGARTGEVVAMTIPNEDVSHYSGDTVSILSSLASRPYSDKELLLDCLTEAERRLSQGDEYEEVIKDFNEQEPVLRLLHEIRHEKPHFLSKINPQSLRRTVGVKVKRNNERILAQHGAFLLFGLGTDASQPSAIPDRWNLTARANEKRIYIAPKAKTKILVQLQQMMIRHHTLFPGLESTAMHLKGKHRPPS